MAKNDQVKIEEDIAAEVAASGLSEEVVRKGRKLSQQSPLFIGFVLMFCVLMPQITLFEIPTILLDVKEMFSMSSSGASWLMTIITVVGIFMAVPSGFYSQRFGAKTGLITACVLVIIGSLIGAFAGVGWVLIVARAIEGIGLMFISTAGPTVINSCVAPERRGTAMGIFGIFGSVAAFGGNVLTPTLFEMFGFSGMWLVYAAATLIACIVLMMLIKMPPKEYMAFLSAQAQQASTGTVVTDKPRFKELMTKDIWCLFAGNIATSMCLLAITSYLPTVLQVKGVDATLSGMITSIPMLLSLVAAPVAGIFSDKIQKTKPFLIAGLVVNAPCLYFLLNSTGIPMWISSIALGCVGLCSLGLYTSGYMALLPRPELASIAMGLLGTIQGVGQFLGAFFCQLLLGPAFARCAFTGIVLAIIELVAAGLVACIKKIK